MKKLLSILIIVPLFVSLNSFNANIKNKKAFDDKEKIEIIFNRQLDFNDIVNIRLSLYQKGIILNYKTLAFDENGKLKSIDFNVDCNNGFRGSAAQENLTNQSRVGFYRDYSENAPSPFGTFCK